MTVKASPERNGAPVLAQLGGLFASACVLPIVLYWALKYGAHLSDGVGECELLLPLHFRNRRPN